MTWADGVKHGSRPHHLWDLHTQCCKKCHMPYYFCAEFYEQAYGCSVSKQEWKRRKASEAMKNPDEPRYSTAGPFTVEATGNPYLAHYRCWLTSDPEKKLCFEGNGREIGEYFEKVCSAVGKTSEHGK